MSNVMADGLIVVALLAGSAACVAACLWLAHRLGAAEVVARGEAVRFRGVRMGLGLVAVGVCVLMMVGAVPGAELLHGWTSLACVGAGLLGILTIGTAQRERGAVAEAVAWRAEERREKRAA
jgi:uncharacterized membrane protein